MQTQTLKPPQPIPYPHSPLLKKLYRLPIFLYRLGFGPMIGKVILIISHHGRKTGKIRRTSVEYFQHEGRLFVMSGFGSRPDWYQNLQADPRAGLKIKNRQICARARSPQGEAEWDQVIAFLKSSPVAQLSGHPHQSQLDEPEVRAAIKNWPVLTFDLTDEPCPAPLEADLTWAWPLILLAAALALLLGWFCLRKH